MEVKIGVQYSARELIVETTLTSEEVEKALTTAIADGGLLSLTDEKGRKVFVPVEKISYLEIANPEPRRVGFSS